MGKGKTLKMVALAVIAVAALLQITEAQTSHVVGDALGWAIPPGAIAYSTWASMQKFAVGDVLVFNFNTGSHDVAEVTKAAFDACNSTGPISFSTTSPTNITLSTATEHYYICTFAGHCAAGQKLAINVSAAAAPAPSPPSPSPTPSAPSPVPTPPAATPTPSTSASPPAPTPSTSASPPAPPPGTSTGTPPPASSSPPPAGSTPPPPPPNGSPPSFAAAALPVTLLSIVVALLH